MEFKGNKLGWHVPDGVDNYNEAFDALDEVAEWLGFSATCVYNKALPLLEEDIFDPGAVTEWLVADGHGEDFDDGDENDSHV